LSNPPNPAPTWTTPSGGAWSYRYDGTSARTAPIITSDDRVVISSTQDYHNLQKHVGQIMCVDLVTLDLLWVNLSAAGVQGTPCLADDVLYAGCNTGSLWAIGAGDGVTQWQFTADANIVTAPVYGDCGGARLLFFATTNGTFYALNLETRTPQWSPFQSAASGQGEAIVTAAAIVGDIAIFAASTVKSGTIYALRIADGSVAWSIGAAAAVRSDPAAHGNLVFFGCDDGTLLAIDSEAGAIEWTERTSRGIAGAPACDDDYVYFGSLDGTFNARALRDDIEPAKWFVQVSTAVTTDIAVHDGVAYFGGQSGAGQSALYLLDLASAEAQSAKVLVDALQAQVNVNRTIQNGHVTFLDTGQVDGTAYAVNVELTSYIDRVNFSSQLIPDDYVAGPDGEATPAAAIFQMTVQILDPNRAPLPNASVLLWAAQEIDGGITCNGVHYDVPLTDTNALSVHADANGQLAITAPGDVGMPALFIRPDFFLRGLSLHVFPDQANLDKLSTVSGTDLSPTPTDNAAGATEPAATSYDGKPIIRQSYYGSLDDIAASMRNTIGRQQNTSNPKLKMSTGAADAQRQLPPGEVTEWTVEIRPDSYNFTHGVSESFPSFAEDAGDRSKSVWGDFEDFVREVVDGTEKVAKTEWKYTEDAAQVVVHCATKAYKFVVKTVEDAVDVLIAIVKEVVEGIRQFIEWLSWLFAWHDMVKVQGKIIDRVNDRLDALANWLTVDAAAKVKDELESLKAEIATAFGSAVTSVEGSTVGSVQNSTGSTSDLLRPSGNDFTVQTGWLPKKLLKYIGSPAIANDAVEDLATLTLAYLDDAREIVTSEFAQLLVDIENAAKSFIELFTEKGGFFAQAVSTILEIFGDILILGVDCVEALVDLTFAYLGAAIKLVKKIINDSFHIDGLSELYSLLTGRKLTLLGFTSLVIAVPATLIAKAGKSVAPKTLTAAQPASPADVASIALNISSALVYLPLAALWTYESTLSGEGEDKLTKREQYIAGTTNVMTCALSLTASAAVDQDRWQDYFFYGSQALQSIPIFLGVSKHAPTSEVENNIWGVCGILSVVESAVWAGLWPKTYSDPDGMSCFNNLFGSIPMFAPWIREALGPEAGPECAIADVAVGYGVSAGLTMYLAWLPVVQSGRSGIAAVKRSPRQR
jgi:outer membrane protein assembly factor BamB